ncbi:hypothetical protein OKW76_03135 [Sphingomonas sp. S1-29]|uniref:hypothetical protein n=1 Tax=Sphingomonas sp. S1-29 TaxID=2991074 RepID=UPI00223F581A|nr:hypothetical protein [Sphingomonas sp. S1-29]UZK70062.1 hypothetical protein OKW76_03135 [Sphingomonas sp. S1-29]
MSIRALSRRVKRLETGAKPTPSPFTLWFGSFDAWVEQEVLPGIESGALEADDMIVIVAALRAWELAGVWNVDHAR